MSAIDTHAAGHDDHGHDHPDFLAHHWDTPQQQFEAGKLGMWLFLATEFLLFGGLFCAYAVWRYNHPEVFAYGSQFLDTTWGAINTVVLIVSSLTMAMAVTAAQMGKQRLLVALLALTFLGGAGFMAIKYKEYSHKFHENIVWGTGFYENPHEDEEGEVVVEETVVETAAPEAPVVEAATDGFVITKSSVPPAAEGPTGLAPHALEKHHLDLARHHEAVAEDASHPIEHAFGHGPHHSEDPTRPANAHVFFGIYFCMTGLHGIHVLVGMIVIAWLAWKAWRGHFSKEYFTPVDLGGLYWHVVDMIWIFLFPLLYLI